MENKVQYELNEALQKIMENIKKENKIKQFIIKFNNNIPAKQQNNNNKIYIKY